eukprot:TRINITY_DN2184_c0_g1_i1.p1 TRINITY_DN2184_c0_g1~~TRINITY_DN2184_c0_g1_i1.p1  ORF type:complete len:590 (+),score=121.19 TRINITY_DN2184_c0_g1_i1:46-1815(+)
MSGNDEESAPLAPVPPPESTPEVLGLSSAKPSPAGLTLSPGEAMLMKHSTEFMNQTPPEDVWKLEGADTTHHIYKAIEKKSNTKERPSTLGCVKDLGLKDEEQYQDALKQALKEPGGYRRAFMSANTTGKRRSIFDNTNFLESLEYFAGIPLSECDPDDGETRSLLSSGHHIRTTSDAETFLTLIKAFVGPAHLYLAKGFADGGVVLSAVGLVICCCLNAYCVGLLIETKYAIGLSSFPELGNYLFGSWMRALVDICLVASQLGLVTMYFIFVAETFRDALANLLDCQHWIATLGLAVLIFAQVILQLPLSLLRQLRSIAFFAILADILIISSMFWVVGSNTSQIVRHPSESATVTFAESKFPLFLGTAVLTFEGIGLMMPIHEAMENPKKFMPMVWISMLFCCALYTVFAVVGFMARGGEEVSTNLLLAMPQSTIAQIAKIQYSLAVTLTFPLQAFPAYRIVELGLRIPSGAHNTLAKWRKNGVRISIVATLGLIAWGGSSSLGNFVAILGGATMCPLAFVFPSMFHYKACAVTTKQKIIDGTICVVGIGCVFLVMGMSTYEWITQGGDTVKTCVTPSPTAIPTPIPM